MDGIRRAGFWGIGAILAMFALTGCAYNGCKIYNLPPGCTGVTITDSSYMANSPNTQTHTVSPTTDLNYSKAPSGALVLPGTTQAPSSSVNSPSTPATPAPIVTEPGYVINKPPGKEGLAQ